MSDIEDSKPPAKKQKVDKDEPVVPLRKSTRANKSTKSFKESDDDEYIVHTDEEEQQEWQEMAAKKSKSKKQTGSKKSGGTKKGGKQLVPAAAGTLPIDAFAIIMTFLHPR